LQRRALLVYLTGKVALDGAAPAGIVGIPCRQGPDGVHMTGQYDHRIQPKGLVLMDCTENIPPAIDVLESNCDRRSLSVTVKK
jgi:hypothetical protein